MTELILSDITRMGPGYCIIGLEKTAGGYRSLRPMPRSGHAWPATLVYKRGWRVQTNLWAFTATKPHLEDRTSDGKLRQAGTMTEEELVKCLRQSEIAEHVRDLFGCLLTESPSGRGFSAEPGEAVRSICGLELQNIRFMALRDEIRAEVVLRDGARLKLPVVDTAWRAFFERALGRIGGANKEQRAQRFLNSQLSRRLLVHPQLFARIGLTRPFLDKCWLMLDSLFPQPKSEWIEDLE